MGDQRREVRIEGPDHEFAGVVGLSMSAKVERQYVEATGESRSEMGPPARVGPSAVQQNELSCRGIAPMKHSKLRPLQRLGTEAFAAGVHGGLRLTGSNGLLNASRRVETAISAAYSTATGLRRPDISCIEVKKTPDFGRSKPSRCVFRFDSVSRTFMIGGQRPGKTG
jgi:hypothetical protein